MNDKTRQRALNAFSAMGSLPDSYITAAENALYEAEAGLYRPERSKGPIRRFLGSGLGVALISGIAALAAVALIIRAGQDPGVVTPPVSVNPPVGTAVPHGEEGSFTIATENRTYAPGIDRIVVVVTGKNLGETITSPGGWSLERITEEGAETVTNCYYTEEYTIADAARDEYASFQKAIFVDGGLEIGRYRLHATRHNGEEYESVTFCEFDVLTEEVDGTESGSEETESGSGEDSDEGAPEQDFGNFTISTEQKTYAEGTSTFTVILQGKNPGESILFPGSWHLYRVTEEGEEPVIGMYYTDEAIDGIAPDENTCATLSKRFFINPHNSDGGLTPGKYILRAVWSEGQVECEFEVVPNETVAVPEDPDMDVTDLMRFYIAYPHDDLTATEPNGVTPFYINRIRLTSG